jgi:hypothetical protein
MQNLSGHQLIGDSIVKIKDEIANAGMLYTLYYGLPINSWGGSCVVSAGCLGIVGRMLLLSKRFSGAAPRRSTIDQETFAVFFALRS